MSKDVDIDEIKQDIKILKKCIMYLLRIYGFDLYYIINDVKEEDL